MVRRESVDPRDPVECTDLQDFKETRVRERLLGTLNLDMHVMNVHTTRLCYVGRALTAKMIGWSCPCFGRQLLLKL